MKDTDTHRHTDRQQPIQIPSAIKNDLYTIEVAAKRHSKYADINAAYVMCSKRICI